MKLIFSLLIFTFFATSSSIYSQDLELEYEFLFELTVMSEPDTIEIGESSIGRRRIVVAQGGSFVGPELNGTVLPNGGDWLLTVDSTTSKIDARGVLQTDDGENIYIHYKGIIRRNGYGGFYFRSTPVFETASEKYSWLNGIVAVGVGEFIEGGVRYKVYAIN